MRTDLSPIWPAVLLALALFSPLASGLGLGEVTVSSKLGEPLRARVSVLELGDALAGRPCSATLEPLRDLPWPRLARVRLGRAGATDEAAISTVRPVLEPALGLVLHLVCGRSGRVSREYVLLLDPPFPLARAAPTAAPLPGPKARPRRGLSARLGGPHGRPAAPRHQPPPPAAASPHRRPPPKAGRAPAEAVRAPEASPPALRILSAAEEPGAIHLRLDTHLDLSRLARRARPPAPPVQLATAGETSVGSVTADAAEASATTAGAGGDTHAVTIQEALRRMDALNRTILDLRDEILALKARAPQPPPAAPVPVPAAAPTPPPVVVTRVWPPLHVWLLLGLALFALAPAFYLLGRRQRPPIAVSPETPVARRERPARRPRPLHDTGVRLEAREAIPPVTPDPAPPQRTVVLAHPYVEPTTQPATAAAESEPVSDTTGSQTGLELESEAVDEVQLQGPAPPREDRGPGHYATSSALLDAELHLLYGQEEQAEAVLNELVGADQGAQADIRPWSMLCDIYHRQGRRDSFDALTERFRRRYNVIPPSWDARRAPGEPQGLEEHFPRVLDTVSGVWGTEEATTLLNGLLLDDRNGERQGFAMDVAEDIGFLIEILRERGSD